MRTPAFLAFACLFSSAAQAAPLEFSRACESGKNLTIAAVGDVLLHEPLQEQAEKRGHRSLWKNVEEWIQAADLSYANFEGPAAEGVMRGGKLSTSPQAIAGDAYTGYPTFNYHPSLNTALLAAGFDFVSTANNHSLDRGAVGVDKTIEGLREAGLPFAGTRTTLEAARGTSTTWHAITDKKGFRIAWIACTFSTNGIADRKDQVLMCFEDANLIEKAIRSLSNDSSVDAVIVTPHWGQQEYTHKIEASQAKLARRFLNAGALAIFGNHPHVTKPWEKIITADGRETFVIYSIGNFVSGQSTLAKQTAPIVFLGLTKRAGEKAFINGVRYMPTYMNQSPYSLAVGRSVPTAARQLLGNLLGKNRVLDEGDPLVTNVECRK